MKTFDYSTWYHSASRIKLLEDCNLAFFHKYILKDMPYEESGPYAQLGTSLHSALETFRKNPTDRKDLINHYIKTAEIDKSHYLHKDGIRIIQGLDLKLVVRGKLIECELPFEEVINGHKVKGVIDKVEELANGTLLITDYKSNQTIHSEEYVHQLAIYDVAMERKFPGSERVHELLYLRHNKSVPFKFSNITESKVMAIFESVESKIDNSWDKPENWNKLPKKGKPCGWCSLKEKCWGK
jgi:RecB family exonuclease